MRAAARRRDLVAVVAIPTLLVVALLSPVLTRGETVVGWDYTSYNAPCFAQLKEAYRALDLHAWNRLSALGQPFAADPAVAAHYPPYALLLVCSPVVALNLLLALHLIGSYVSAWSFARSRGLSLRAAHLTALAYGLSGMAIGYLSFPSLLWGHALLPWAVRAAVRALAPGAPAARLMLAAPPFTLIFLVGAVETCVCAALLAFGLALADGAGLLRAARRLVAIALVSGALGALSLVPFAANLSGTNRGAGLHYDISSARSLRPLELLGLGIPGYLPIEPPADADELPLHTSPSMGLVALALAAAGAASRRREARPMVVLALLGALYSLGRHGPLYPVLWELLPQLRSIRMPAKAFAVTTFALALLAGVGLDALWRTAGPAASASRAGRSAAGLALAALLVGAGAAALALADGGLQRGAILAVPVAAAAAVVFALRSASAPLARRALYVVLVVELVVSARLALVLGPGELYGDAPPPVVAALRAEEALRGAPVRISSSPSIKPTGFQADHKAFLVNLEGTRRRALRPNMPAWWGIACAETVASSYPQRFSALRDELARRRLPADRVLQATGVTHIITERPLPGLVTMPADDGLFLQRVAQPPPWAATYTRVHAASNLEAAIERVLAPGYSAADECVVEGLGGVTDVASGAEPARPARILELGHDRLALEVDGPAGWLVVREGYALGWSATVDGEPTPVHPADAVYRAVPVPAGPHVVVMTYTQRGRRLGLVISGLAWLAVLVLTVREARARR